MERGLHRYQWQLFAFIIISFVISKCYSYRESRNTYISEILVLDSQHLTDVLMTILKHLTTFLLRTFGSHGKFLTIFGHTLPSGCSHILTDTFSHTHDFVFVCH